MKLQFSLRARLPGLNSPIFEYLYEVRFVGTTNKGDFFTSSWAVHSSHKKTAKEAKKEIEKRIIGLGHFDLALDGIDPYNI